MLVGTGDTPPEPEKAIAFYAAAIREGSGAAALRASVMAAIGVGSEANWRAAFDLLARAAELGETSARRQLAVLAGVADWRGAAQTSVENVWVGVRQALDIDTLLTAPQLSLLSREPIVGVVENFATPTMAQWLIATASERLLPRQVNDAKTGQISSHAMGTATAASFPILQRDMVTLVMQERAARLTQVPLVNHEPPNVISYQPGQQSEPRYDFVDPRVPQFQQELAILGQRIITVVTYLNADFEGAEMVFPELGLSFRGKVGGAIVFFNVTPKGQPELRSLHAGTPPTRGRKWVLSQWLRDKPQPLV